MCSRRRGIVGIERASVLKRKWICILENENVQKAFDILSNRTYITGCEVEHRK